MRKSQRLEGIDYSSGDPWGPGFQYANDCRGPREEAPKTKYWALVLEFTEMF